MLLVEKFITFSHMLEIVSLTPKIDAFIRGMRDYFQTILKKNYNC